MRKLTLRFLVTIFAVSGIRLQAKSERIPSKIIFRKEKHIDEINGYWICQTIDVYCDQLEKIIC